LATGDSTQFPRHTTLHDGLFPGSVRLVGNSSFTGPELGQDRHHLPYRDSGKVLPAGTRQAGAESGARSGFRGDLGMEAGAGFETMLVTPLALIARTA
jgi:hypothetical protein